MQLKNKKSKRPSWIIQVFQEGLPAIPSLQFYYGGDQAVLAPKNCKSPGLLLGRRDGKQYYLKPDYTAVRGDAENFPIRKEAVMNAMDMLSEGDVVGVRIERVP